MNPRSIHINDVFPKGWRGYFAPTGRVGIGMDLGTTTKAKSNPSALAITQEVGLDFIVRLALRWKTSNPEVSFQILQQALELPHGLAVRKVCIDASNERFFAADIKSKLAGRVTVEPVINSESITYLGQKMLVKSYLGNLFINTIDDGHLWLPSEAWLEKDIRSVKSEKGTFSADVDEEGNHADVFDGIKLSLHALVTKGGPVQANPTQVGTFGGQKPQSGHWKNPYANKHEKRGGLRPI